MSTIKKKNPGGRPLKFKSPKALQAKIDAYFKKVGWQTKTVLKNNEPTKIEFYVPATITGLALALDTSRKVLCEYEGRDAFSNAIKKAKANCEDMLFEGGLTKQLDKSVTIFGLKNNFGWEDKKEIGIDGNINIEITRGTIEEK